MGTVTIDGNEITVGNDEHINVIQAAWRVGISIPHYCWHAGLTVVGSCRMCHAWAESAAPRSRSSSIPRGLRWRRSTIFSRRTTWLTCSVTIAYMAAGPRGLPRVVDGDLVKILSWYDNEWGYANQLVRHATAMLSSGG